MAFSCILRNRHLDRAKCSPARLPVFESEFLSPFNQSLYRRCIADAAETLCLSLPQKPYSGKTPTELDSLIASDFLPKVAAPADKIADIFRSVVANSVSVAHPHTAAHLHCPPLLSALAAEVVISTLNQSMDSFDQAPIATMVEQKLVRWLCNEAGFAATADGTFTTGGSQSNYMGLLLARDAFAQKHWNIQVQKSGLPPDARRLRILCSEVAHFTAEKSAAQLGLGTDAVVRVPVDHNFRMIPAALRDITRSLQNQNLLPMAVIATAGTTDFGSIDPLAEIITLARSVGAWVHLDAAYGGALLFSGQHRSRLEGIESADSISIDFHKLLWQPIPCSVFLLCDARHFDLIKMHADYLNPEFHEEEGIPDLVTKSLLTSRRFDALKLWISFQTLGRTKLATMIDRTIALARHAGVVISNTPQLELVAEPQLSTVVFRFVPSRHEFDADEINASIRRTLLTKGDSIIGQTRVRNRQCLKFTFMNPTVADQEMETLVARIVEEGKENEKLL